MRINYLPNRFVPAPGIAFEKYYKWIETCTFDDDGWVRDKRGKNKAQWYKYPKGSWQESGCSEDFAFPANLWYDIDRVEGLYIDAIAVCDAETQKIQALLKKYRDRMKDMRVSNINFCWESPEGKWTKIQVCDTGYVVDHSEDAPEFQITLDNVHCVNTLGDSDLVLFVVDDMLIWQRRAMLQSILVEAVHDRCLKDQNKCVESVVRIETKHFYFIFQRQLEHPNGDRHSGLIWRVILGPIVKDMFATCDLSDL